MCDFKTTPLYAAIYSVARQIPFGRVTTYGKIAQQVGCNARTVGFALAALPENSDVPWQRIINAQGKVSLRSDREGNLLQQILLEKEGIYFQHSGKIDLDKFLWNPANSGQKKIKKETE